MIALVELWHQLRDSYYRQDKEDVSRKIEEEFIERLTFSDFDEIWAVLKELYVGSNYLDMPVWIRNLAYRLACLLQPENADIRRYAARDLYNFGNEWPEEVRRLQAEAEEIERRDSA